MPLNSFSAEEILYRCVAILAVVGFGSGFARFFASSFAEAPGQQDVKIDLNPFTNLDVIGTVVFFLGGFGWGRQPDSRIRFKHQRIGWLVISLIAPFSSLVIALTAAYVKYFLWTDRVVDVLINLSVATTAYHVVPIPPLAGSRFLYVVFPHDDVWKIFSRVGPYVILLLVGLDRFAGFDLLRDWLNPVVRAVGNFVAY